MAPHMRLTDSRSASAVCAPPDTNPANPHIDAITAMAHVSLPGRLAVPARIHD
jgi:hypothetical protein